MVDSRFCGLMELFEMTSFKEAWREMCILVFGDGCARIYGLCAQLVSVFWGD